MGNNLRGTKAGQDQGKRGHGVGVRVFPSLALTLQEQCFLLIFADLIL